MHQSSGAIGRRQNYSLFLILLLTLAFLCLSGCLVAGEPAAAASSTTAVPAGLSVEDIIRNIEGALQKITDISCQVEFNQPKPDGSTARTFIEVQATMSGVLRMTFLEPPEFADVIYIFDKPSNKVTQYSPITGIAVVQYIDQVAKGIPIPDNIGGLFSLPSAAEYDLSVNGKDDSGRYVIVAAKGVNNSTNNNSKVNNADSKNNADNLLYHFWVDTREWLTTRICVYDQNGGTIYTISYNSIRRNGNLKESNLRRLPPRTEINDWT